MRGRWIWEGEVSEAGGWGADDAPLETDEGFGEAGEEGKNGG